MTERHVVVASGEPRISAITSAMVRTGGYRARAVGDGFEALASASRTVSSRRLV